MDIIYTSIENIRSETCFVMPNYNKNDNHEEPVPMQWRYW
jgi:hypothetical protein